MARGVITSWPAQPIYKITCAAYNPLVQHIIALYFGYNIATWRVSRSRGHVYTSHVRRYCMKCRISAGGVVIYTHPLYQVGRKHVHIVHMHRSTNLKSWIVPSEKSALPARSATDTIGLTGSRPARRFAAVRTFRPLRPSPLETASGVLSFGRILGSIGFEPKR